MYAVIFKAEIAQLDDEYSATAARMRELATSQYGCLEFSACCEENREIAISYWPSLEHIKRWKQDPEHLAAQKQGRNKWYHNYQVQVVELLRQYSH
ncbi:antibiotic biosynthesis monooxygenase family protein [Alkalimarinus coralli]|uniref:antibiotic biosynthesis monooxygenase family protein n=1 Tax=Alkalimarinus coralli TaxID=2935863 RepID=UPI00202B9964|nr:DUF4188 domain-containing protein [Alkalimarinus coralli]